MARLSLLGIFRGAGVLTLAILLMSALPPQARDECVTVFGGPCESELQAAGGVCGNEITEGDEECDDGNNLDGDGCRATCTLPVGSADDFLSDDFNTCELASQWTIYAPGTGTLAIVGAGTGNASLEFTLPEGDAHDAFQPSGNGALRVMQPATDGDLEIEAAFEAEPNGRFTDQGLLVEQDADNWLRFDTFHDGTNLKAFIGQRVDGANTGLMTVTIPDGSALYQRVIRNGNDFSYWISGDGQNWTMVGVINLSLEVTTVGVFAANPVTGIAYTANVDWFFNVAAPIDPEDGGSLDADGDGVACDDCDNADPNNYPGNEEVCDGQDNDCNGEADFPDETIDADGDGSPECADCDESDAANYPGNDEACDGRDNDCNGEADFPGETTDGDGDGVVACLDCDDADATNFPGNVESCDGRDNDCNAGADFPGETTDADSDGSLTCADCDDADAANFPGNVESCDGQDNDCNAGADFPGETTDADNDGSLTCADCDDADAANFPGNVESCDLADNDCNGLADFPGEDTDGDSDGSVTCMDCDDADPLSYPGAPELCDEADNDCDGMVDEDFDVDGDGFTSCGGDCDDDDANIFPGAPEFCHNGVDDDCDTLIDMDDDDCEDMLVVLESLTVESTERGTLVRWVTSAEFDNVGFRVIRVAIDGKQRTETVLNGGLIPARGSELGGASYSYLDNSVQPGGEVEYYLEDVDLYGVVTRHGPAESADGDGKSPSLRKAPRALGLN